MEDLKQIFKNINKEYINENMDNLIDNGDLDSMDIMILIAEIEKFYKKPLKSDFIKMENFKNFQSIKKMIKEGIN
ncbi:acyl carrier protein [Campylobacter volucris]|uniref:Acyl carrier protein n=1 Tax=Campylobacter volucris TaxID=1031542 RepID=A0A5C7DY80_9BACT|nr:acyl carrier protein [Campylobacter volucris]TXE85661.1 acyl carrier protein [Campylobacter volucris]